MTTGDTTNVRGRLDEVGRQIEQLTRLNLMQSALRSRPREAEPNDDGNDVLSRLDRELEGVSAAAPAADAPFSDRLAAADPDRDAPPIAPEPTSPLEQALMEIAERQRVLEAGGGPTASHSSRPDLLPRAPTQDLSRLEDQLRRITDQFEGLRPCGLDSAVETLRNDLAEIGLMVKEAMPRHAIEALEGEVRSLSERLHQNRSSDSTDTAIVGVEHELAEIRAALRALTPAENLMGVDQAVQALSQKIELIATDTQDAAAFAQLENAIEALRGIVAHVASDGTLAQLSDEMRSLAAKVDQIAASAGTDTGLLSTLEHRIASLADALETRTAGGPLPLDLDAVVQGLADKLEGVGLTHFDQAAVGQLEDRIGRLVDKLDTSAARLDHLESIEHALSDLLANVHQSQPAQGVRASADPGDASELRRDMQQTQSSLQTVQGSLTRLMDRLSTIEADIRGAAAAAPIIPRTPTGGEEPKVAPPAAAERRPIDPSLPPDHPLEPGAVRGRAASSPGERIAASEAALGGVKSPAAASDPGGKTSFIAAARRAAQAASSETGTHAEARTRSSKKPAAPAGTTTGGWRDRTRKILVAASVAVIVLGSLHYVAALFSGSDDAGESAQAPSSPQQDAPAAAPSSGATKGSDADHDPPPAPAPPLPPGTSPQKQSLLIPMGDGTSLSFPTSGLPTRVSGAPESPKPIAIDLAAVRSDPARVTAAAVADSETTGTIPHAPVGPPSTTATAQPVSAEKLPPSVGAKLRAAAAKGDPAAEYEIAERYAEGRGLPQSFTETAAWFDRAAKQGLAPAQFRLGGLYEKGVGVTKDLDTARRLYLAAADAGNAKAMHNLAVLYAEGIDGKPDYATAAKWFRKAADYGLTDSQYNLAVLYARGIGIDVNLGEAYKWFALAARDGDHEAIAKRDDVAGRLGQVGLEAAKAAVQSFVAEQQPDAAVQPTVPPGGWDSAAVTPPASAKARNSGPKLDLSTPMH